MIGVKKQFDTDFEPPINCVSEKVLDEVSYQAHLKLYHDQNKRLQEEFKQDLLKKYHIVGHPKATQVFNKAWDLGCSSGLYDVEGYFQELIELLNEPSIHIQLV